MLYRGPMGGGAASGAVGALVVSHNRSGQYMRARTVPTNPATDQQQAVRNAVKSLTSRFQETLTAAQRTAWQTYANNVTTTNALGDTINMTASNAFTRSNVSRQQASQTQIDPAPTQFDLGTFTAPTLTLGASSSSGTITYTAADSWVATSSAAAGMLVYTSRPQAASINFFKGPYRFAARVNGTSGTATFTLPFAAGPITTKTFFQVRVARSDGRLSSAFSGSVVPS